MAHRRAFATGQPDIAGDGGIAEDESPDRAALEKVEERWVPALVRAKVIGREADLVSRPTVNMGGEVSQAVALRLQHGVADEVGSESMMPALAGPGTVVHTVGRPDQPPNQEPSADVGVRHTRQERGCMRASVPRKEMVAEIAEDFITDPHGP